MQLLARDIVHRWNGRETARPALDHVSAEFEPGTAHIVCGPSGAGKSTLGLVLSGLVKPSVGVVTLDADDVGSALSRIAYAFQFPETIFFEDTVEAEIAGIKSNGQGEIASGVFDALGINLQAIKNHHPFHLSSGYARMVAIALQMARQPQVLILDEPSIGLDWHFSLTMIRVLREWISPDRILIVITHDLDFMAELRGMSWVVAEGRLAWRGETGSLLSDEDLLRRHHLVA